ncbi:MAG: tetratricopeptide repeat protein [Thermodesulfobacteriota bacterium]
MARRKKITKKKLKEPDEFISLTAKAYLFITRYLKQLATGGIILLVLILAFLFLQRWEKGNELDADQKFSLAVQLYQKITSPYREGTPAEYKSLLEGFSEVVSRFPRTSPGKLSLLYRGDIHLRLGEFEAAIKEYQAFLQKAGNVRLYRLLAMEGMGYAYEGMKDYEKALHAYQKIVEMGESFESADAHLNMGRYYERMGENKEALENYRAFLKISEKSPVANAVLRKISLLEK